MNELEAGTGRTRVRLIWKRWGSDLHVHIAAGEHHVGAAALVGRQPDGETYEGGLCVPPHKEDQLVLDAARTLHAATAVNVCVTAGIHLDAITGAEISAVVRNVDEAVARIAGMLRCSDSRLSRAVPFPSDSPSAD